MQSQVFFSRKMLAVLFLWGSISVAAQSKVESFLTPSDSLNLKRRNFVYVSEAVLLGGTLVGLNQIWYEDYPKSSFHFIDDNEENVIAAKSHKIYGIHYKSPQQLLNELRACKLIF